MGMTNSHVGCCIGGLLVVVAFTATPARAQLPRGVSPGEPIASKDGAGPTGRWGDALSVFVGPDGSKQPQDLGINANMGLRLGMNWAVPLRRSAGLGVQVGLGQNFSDAAVHVLDQIEGTSRRTQTFLTAGLFQRVGRLDWGLSVDVLRQRYYDQFLLAQLRGRVGVAVRADDQVGAILRVGVKGDRGAMGGTPVTLDPIDQVSAFHRHTWANLVQTTVSAGMVNGHSDLVWVIPGDRRNRRSFVYGAEIQVPLSEKFALSGASNLILPAASGTVDAYLGVVWFPGHGAMRAPTHRFAPALAVANNPEFAVDLRR